MICANIRKNTLQNLHPSSSLIAFVSFTAGPVFISLPADVLWGSFVPPWGRNECVTNEPQRTSAGRLCFYGLTGIINHRFLTYQIVHIQLSQLL